MKNEVVLYLPDGTTILKADLRTHVEHVTIPYGSFRVGIVEGDRRHDSAYFLLSSLLVVPWHPGVSPITPDYGRVVLKYNERTQVDAPVIALANRYHGLTLATQLITRFRLLVDPNHSVSFDDMTFNPVPSIAVLMRAQLSIGLRHIAVADAIQPESQRPITVELQGLISGWATLKWDT